MYAAATLLSSLAIAATTNTTAVKNDEYVLAITCSACDGQADWECPASAASGETFTMTSKGSLAAEVNSDSTFTATIRAFGLTLQQTTLPACGPQQFDVLDTIGKVTTELYDTCPKESGSDFESKALMSINANAAGAYEADFRVYGKDTQVVGCVTVYITASKVE